ncbi:RiPP maturation radical SAM C-methyltransferase [uncultured Paludibaculum sp.]|uniref:RiPP maturation radical SAM C-methyltransferase n=1 Tax=uncultured Paludibaculum sp. TaxID=1765020 RepID=UPI002AAB8A1E|nr:RiPP maturation radical SAM C-methyltransferase [uncultured Paludibaculum sp.]
MYEVALISMPFGGLLMPSIGLAQLRYAVEHAHPGQVRVRNLYLSHDFAAYLGFDLYQEIFHGRQHHASGVADWFFRQAAFPDAADNASEFFARYYPRRDAATTRFRNAILQKRAGVAQIFQRLIEQYHLGEYHLVGFTATTFQNVASFAFARILTSLHSNITVIIGGGNCEYPMGAAIVRNVPAIDYVFSGPGLVSLPRFVGCRLSGEIDRCDDIPGVLSISNSRLWAEDHRAMECVGRSGADALRGEHLDINIPIPLDYDDFFESLERALPDVRVPTAIPFQTSRGCWWGEKLHCRFCGTSENALRYSCMDPDLAIQQINSIFSYASRTALFHCTDSILAKQYFLEVLPKLKVPENVRLWYEAKSDLTERDVMTLASIRAGVQIGIEALATSSLKLLGKGSTAFQNVALLRCCAQYDVMTSWNLLIGVPGETSEAYRKYISDIPKLLHLPPPAAPYPIRFDRFSPYFDNAAKYGLELRPYDSYFLIYPFPESRIREIAFFFVDQNVNADYFTAMMEWIAPLRKVVEIWNMRWHGRGRDNRPRLEFESAGASGFTIYDSRPERPLRLTIDDLSVHALSALRSPKTVPELAAGIGVSEAEAGSVIAELNKRALLFHEGERFLSLVTAGTLSDRIFRNQTELQVTT